MKMALIELYDSYIKFPDPEAIRRNGKQMAFLVYITPYCSSIIEYAGRTCYKSFDAIKDDSYAKFIRTIIGYGHESVIEHSNLVYIILKPTNKAKESDSDTVNRYLINLMMYNGLLNVSENQAFYTISGNLRMFKDLVREYQYIRSINNKYNQIIEDIKNSFYTLPEYYFEDMIKDGSMELKKFNKDETFIEASSSLNFKKLNDYVTVINHDNFSFKVRGFLTVTNGVTTVKHLNIPRYTLNKHNRMTIVIEAPRYITHQLVRHRLASYSQASQRYIHADSVNVYIPESFKEHHGEVLAMNHFNNTHNIYDSLIDLGIKQEDARAVLPNAEMSSVVMTATIAEFEHFIKLRADKAAQNFIRDMIAIPIKEYLENYYRSDEDGKGPSPCKENYIKKGMRKPNKYERQQEAKKNRAVNAKNKYVNNNSKSKPQDSNKVRTLNNNSGNKNYKKSNNKPNNQNKSNNKFNKNNKPQKKNFGYK